MKTIILVEDDAAIQDVFSLALDKSLYNIIGLASGDQILSGQIPPPDLFILDKNISGTNGLDVCRFIKSNRQYQAVPVIIISASPGIEKMAAEAGADNVLPKPFSLKLLRATISKYLHTD